MKVGDVVIYHEAVPFRHRYTIVEITRLTTKSAYVKLVMEVQGIFFKEGDRVPLSKLLKYDPKFVEDIKRIYATRNLLEKEERKLINSHKFEEAS